LSSSRSSKSHKVAEEERIDKIENEEYTEGVNEPTGSATSRHYPQRTGIRWGRNYKLGKLYKIR
jgi:hypothetical protein